MKYKIGRLVFGFIFLLSLMDAFWGTAVASDKPAFVQKPEWVEENSIPEFTMSALSTHLAGEAWLLSDQQTSFIQGGNSTYYRHVTKVIDRIGLEGSSNLTITIDPSRQKLGIVRIQVMRNGTKSDQTNNLHIDSFRKETEIQSGVFRGSIQHSILIPDVRVGDTVDVSYLVETIEVVSGLPFYRYFSLAFDAPVERIYRRIVWPKDRPLNIKNFNTSFTPVIKEHGTNKVYTWDLAKTAPWKPEPDQAPGENLLVEVAISEASGWHEIVNVLLPFYRTDGPLPEVLVSRLDEISRKYPDESERMTEALRIVQDEIRYVSLSIGPGALIPRSPVDVHSSGYGDCKDKALLLATMLERMGIPAYVALADLDQGYGVADQPPSIGAFDHAIVRVDLKAFPLWLDATDYSQGGRGYTIAQADYGFALPLKSGTKDVEQLQTRTTVVPTQTTTETFEFPKTKDGGLVVEVETVYSHHSADRFRKNLASSGADQYAEDYFQYYLKRIPGLKKGKAIEIKDDREKNDITIREYYRLPDFDVTSMDIGREFPITALLGLGNLPEAPEGPRTKPLYIGVPYNFKHVVVVKNLETSFGVTDPPSDISPWFTYNASSAFVDGSSILTWNLTSTGKEVEARDLLKYKTALANLKDNSDRLYNFAYVEETAPRLGKLKDPSTTSAVLVIVMLVIGIFLNIAKPAQTYHASAFQPVSLPKFLVMSLLTGGLYNYLWAWNGFRNQKAQTGKFSVPFLQAIIHPLLAFNIMNSVSTAGLLGANKGTGGLIFIGILVYFLAGVADISVIFSDKLDFVGTWGLVKSIGLILVQAVALLPFLGQLIKLNAQQIETEKTWAKFGGWDYLSIVTIAPIVTFSILVDFWGY